MICGKAVGLFGSLWKGPVMLALKLPLWDPCADPLRLMSTLPLVTFVGLLKVCDRTCCGSALLLLDPPPQPATAAGMGRAIASTATMVRMRLN